MLRGQTNQMSAKLFFLPLAFISVSIFEQRQRLPSQTHMCDLPSLWMRSKLKSWQQSHFCLFVKGWVQISFSHTLITRLRRNVHAQSQSACSSFLLKFWSDWGKHWQKANVWVSLTLWAGSKWKTVNHVPCFAELFFHPARFCRARTKLGFFCH